MRSGIATGLDRAGWEATRAILRLPRLHALLVRPVSTGPVPLVMVRRTGPDPRLLAVLIAMDGAAEARATARQAPLSTLFLTVAIAVFALMLLLAGRRPVEMDNRPGAPAIALIALGTWASITSLVVILTLRRRAPVLAYLIATAFVTGWLFDAGFNEVDTVV